MSFNTCLGLCYMKATKVFVCQQNLFVNKSISKHLPGELPAPTCLQFFCLYLQILDLLFSAGKPPHMWLEPWKCGGPDMCCQCETHIRFWECSKKVQFSHSVMSNSLWPHGLQHARPPCSSPTPGACSNSCPSSQWCHAIISSSVVCFSSYLQFFPASGSFLVSLHQVAKVLEFQLQHQSFQWIFKGLISFWMDWLALLAVQGTLKSLLQHHSSKASILWHSAFFIVQLSHPYMTTGKNIALTRWTFVGKVISLLFNMLSRFGLWLGYIHGSLSFRFFICLAGILDQMFSL